jgi:Tfp pilus assembly major pilin PilA
MRVTTKAGLLSIMLVGVIATTALAAGKTYHGTVGESGSVEFTLVTKNGNSKVTGFKFHGLEATCSQGTAHLDGTFPDKARVQNGSYKVSIDLGPYNVVAKGQIAGRQASGTLQARGDIDPGQLDHCETGKVPWTASR